MAAHGSMMFLALSDVEHLTGFSRYTAKCRWLADHGYRFEVNALGHPVVLSSAVEEKLRSGARSSRQPKFEALSDG